MLQKISPEEMKGLSTKDHMVRVQEVVKDYIAQGFNFLAYTDIQGYLTPLRNGNVFKTEDEAYEFLSKMKGKSVADLKERHYALVECLTELDGILDYYTKHEVYGSESFFK